MPFQYVFTWGFVLLKLMLNKYFLAQKLLWGITSVQQSAFGPKLIIDILGCFFFLSPEVKSGRIQSCGKTYRKNTRNNILWILTPLSDKCFVWHIWFINQRTLIKIVLQMIWLSLNSQPVSHLSTWFLTRCSKKIISEEDIHLET